jgi:hypothetical protein
MIPTRAGVIPHACSLALASRMTRHTRVPATGVDMKPSLMSLIGALRGIWDRDRLAEANTSVGDRAPLWRAAQDHRRVRMKGWA